MQFLDLPLEIRINIYRHLFSFPQSIQVWTFLPDQNKVLGLHAQLLHTCRQIASEAAPILYGIQRFSSMHNILPIAKIPLYIGRQNLSYISHLQIHTREILELSLTLSREEDRPLYQGLAVLEMLSRFALRTQPDMPDQHGTLSARDTIRFEILCRTARTILTWCPRLNIVGQRLFRERFHCLELQWRFVENESRLTKDETALSLESLSEPVDIENVLRVT